MQCAAAAISAFLGGAVAAAAVVVRWPGLLFLRPLPDDELPRDKHDD